MIKNLNTPSFWNNRLRKQKQILFTSPIFLHKNKIVLSYLKNINKDSILDIGVGNGYIEKLINEKYKKVNLFGIDISSYSINELNKKYKHGFKVGNIKKIRFSDLKFDLVICLDILEHLTNQELNRGMTEIYRVLKKDGCLIISVPINENTKDSKSNRHLTVFNYKVMDNLLDNHKFKIIEHDYLYAYSHLYYLKTFIVKILKIKKMRPNLLIVKAIKL